MKKIVIFIILQIISLNVIAQNIELTFNPKNSSDVIDSIKAINLSTGETMIASGTNIIRLIYSASNEITYGNSSEKINVFPNPFKNRTECRFYMEQSDNVKVLLINAFGQILAENHQRLNEGSYRFKISVNSEGLYFVLVVGEHVKFSKKIISTEVNSNLNKIEFVGSSFISETEKHATVDEPDLFHFFIYSGERITKIADTPTESKTYEVEFRECKDADGRNYAVIKLGYWWMAENLAYNIGEGCWAYKNDEKNVAKYGRLYTWEAAKKACPSGWILAYDGDWKALEKYIGMSQEEANKIGFRGTTEGAKLKATFDWENNGYGSDIYGFSGLPGGFCYGGNSFSCIGYEGYWWSDTKELGHLPWIRKIYYDSPMIIRSEQDEKNGLSVRCVWD